MLYIIALLLFFILLAIVWGKNGIVAGLWFIFTLSCACITLVIVWIYWPAFVALYGDGESFWGGVGAIAIIALVPVVLHYLERFK